MSVAENCAEKFFIGLAPGPGFESTLFQFTVTFCALFVTLCLEKDENKQECDPTELPIYYSLFSDGTVNSFVPIRKL